jgi:hypothetical protein
MLSTLMNNVPFRPEKLEAIFTPRVNVGARCLVIYDQAVS